MDDHSSAWSGGFFWGQQQLGIDWRVRVKTERKLNQVAMNNVQFCTMACSGDVVLDRSCTSAD